MHHFLLIASCPISWQHQGEPHKSSADLQEVITAWEHVRNLLLLGHFAQGRNIWWRTSSKSKQQTWRVHSAACDHSTRAGVGPPHCLGPAATQKPAQDTRQGLGSKEPQSNTLPELFHSSRCRKLITKANKFFLRTLWVTYVFVLVQTKIISSQKYR